MEEYAPIFWVLLTVAAMVVSSVSKARKQAAKAQKEAPGQPGQPFDEAWPRMEEKASEAGRSETRMGTETWTGQRAGTETWTGPKPGSAYTPASAGSHEAYTAETDYAEEAYSAEGYTEEAYFEEAQSLEEIPADMFLTETASAAFRQMQPRNHRAMRTPAAKASINEKTGSDGMLGTDNMQSATADEPIEEFDLRKAVIYSEILKPKFEE